MQNINYITLYKIYNTHTHTHIYMSAEDTGSIPRSGRSPGEGNGDQLLYSCLGNPMDRGSWWTTVHGVAKELDMT